MSRDEQKESRNHWRFGFATAWLLSCIPISADHQIADDLRDAETNQSRDSETKCMISRQIAESSIQLEVLHLGSLEFRGYARCGGEGAEDGDDDHREDWEEAMWVFFTFHICGFLGGGEKA